MIDNLKVATATVVFWFGYYWYKIFGKTPWYSYLSLRKLFYSSNTQFNKRVSERIAKENSVYSGIEASGVLGTYAQQDLERVSSTIQSNGYYIFPVSLKEETIKYLTQLSFRTKAKLTPQPKDAEAFSLFDRENPKAIKYQFLEEDLVQDPVIQELMTDQSIIAVAQSFLKSKPVIDLVSMWWSTAVSKQASSEVAQLYHWDMERIKFIKFFFYLTDVDTDTGPHCYIEGSNNGFPESVRRDGRVSDEEIRKAYPADKIIEIVGKRGTIMAVDTSGFHKGKNLKHSDRLLLQFELSNSLFGINSEYFKISNPTSKFRQAAGTFPFVFQRYTLN